MSNLSDLESSTDNQKPDDNNLGSGLSSVSSNPTNTGTSTPTNNSTSSVGSSSGSASSSSNGGLQTPTKGSNSNNIEKSFTEEDTDAEIEAMRRRVKEMEEEAAKIEAMQSNVEKTLKPQQVTNGPSVDARSIYVGNVDYSTSPEELQEFFQSCGTVSRITILCDKYTGHPKGYAYVEFKDQEAIVNAMILNETEFKGRPLKISPKRTNIPGLSDYRPRAKPRPPQAVSQSGRSFRRRFSSYNPRPRYRHRRAVYHPYY